MKKKILIIVIIFLVVIGGLFCFYVFTDFFREQNDSIVNEPVIQKDSAILDLTDLYNDINSDTSLKFQTKFNSGSATPTKIKDYLTVTENGYSLNFKNNTPVTTPCVFEGKVYVSAGFGTKSFYCFDLESGVLEWAMNLNDDGPSTPVCTNETVFFNTESCTIFGLDRLTGTNKWSFWLGDPLVSKPSVHDGNVYTAYPSSSHTVMESSAIMNDIPTDTSEMSTSTSAKNKKGNPSHALACFDANNGSIQWQTWLDGDILGEIVVGGKYLYFTTFSGTLYKVNKSNGGISAASALNATSVPTIESDQIYITRRTTENNQVYESIISVQEDNFELTRTIFKTKAPYLDSQIQKGSNFEKFCTNLDIGNMFGEIAPYSSGWEKANKITGVYHVSSMQLFQHSTVSIHGCKIYNLMGDIINCIDPNSNKVIWSYKIEGDIKKEGGTLGTTPIVQNGKLYCVTIFGDLMVFNANSGKIEFQFNVGSQVRTAPVVLDNKVLIPTTNGKLILVNTDTELKI